MACTEHVVLGACEDAIVPRGMPRAHAVLSHPVAVHTLGPGSPRDLAREYRGVYELYAPPRTVTQSGACELTSLRE